MRSRGGSPHSPGFASGTSSFLSIVGGLVVTFLGSPSGYFGKTKAFTVNLGSRSRTQYTCGYLVYGAPGGSWRCDPELLQFYPCALHTKVGQNSGAIEQTRD